MATATVGRTPKLDKDLDYAQLVRGIQASRLQMRFVRDQKREAVKLDAGTHWGDNAAEKRQPVNILSLYRRIVGRSLISKNPRFMLSTHDKSLLSMVEAIQTWGNRQLDKMSLVDVLKEAVTDAMYFIGIVKVGLADPGASMLSGWEVKAGEPCAWVVSLDDFVYDVHAKKFREAWKGHKYRVPKVAVEKDKSYSAARKDLPDSPDKLFNEQGDMRTSALSRGFYHLEEFEKMVDLWEIYIPSRRIIVTMRADEAGNPVLDDQGKPLRIQPWIGPYCGPYHILKLGDIPDNAMGKGPILDLLDMHEAINVQWRKLIDQARRQKSILAANRMKLEDAERIRQEPDGGVVGVDGDPPTAVDYGGPSATVYNLTDAMTKLVSWLAGNMDMLGGLSPQSKTASQDKLLAQNASGMVQDFQEITVNFTADVISALCWYWCKHPNKVMKAKYSPQGMPEVMATRTVTPEMRLALDFDELDIEVDPYSMRHRTPQDRLEAIIGVLKELYLPLSLQAAQQGVYLNLNQLFALVGQMLDEPRFAGILETMEPAPQGNQGGAGQPEQPGMPQTTTRNYNRRSMGGDQSPGSQTNRTQNSMQQIAASEPSMNGTH